MLGRSRRTRSRLTAAPPLPRPLPVCASLPEARRFAGGPFPAGERLRSPVFRVRFCLASPCLLTAWPHPRPRAAFPALPVELPRPDGGREGPRGASETAPAGLGVSRARSLAARRSSLLPAGPGAPDSPLGERDLRGHAARAQRFRFSEEPGLGAEGAVLEVRVPQVLHLQYGMYVWPCAVVLAQYLWFHRRSLPGKAVLEVRVIGLTWGHVSQDLLALPPQDIILASDVFFEPEDFEDILTTVYFLMQKNPKVQLWSTYQVRSADWSLEALLYKWDMKCVHIPLESFDADKEDIAESALPGRHTVEMLVISFAKDSL